MQITSQRTDKIHLFALGDLHIANKAFHKNHFKRLASKIMNTPHSAWIGMGDMAECILPSDIRFDQRSLRDEYRNDIDKLPQLEVRELKKLLEPIKNI